MTVERRGSLTLSFRQLLTDSITPVITRLDRVIHTVNSMSSMDYDNYCHPLNLDPLG
jgi:hypothetical protein